MTDDRRFEDALNASETVGGKEIKTMCDVLDRVEARGKAEGIAEGEARGEVQGKKEMAINLHKQSVPVEVIAKAAGVAVDVVKKWLGLETA
jgi:predicted transposase YdaD